jgi:transposase
MCKPCTEFDRLVQRRTALINEIRGFLLKRGITFPSQPIHLRKNLPTVVEDAEQNLTPRLRWLLDRLWQEWKQTELAMSSIQEVQAAEKKVQAVLRELKKTDLTSPGSFGIVHRLGRTTPALQNLKCRRTIHG